MVPGYTHQALRSAPTDIDWPRSGLPLGLVPAL